MKRLTWKEVAAWRVGRHYLDTRAPAGSLLPVVSRLCGLHAQLMSSAELSVWARVEGCDRETLPKALWEDRTLVKSWAMRGTLHLLPSAELPLWHGALSTSDRFLKPAQWQKHFGLSMKQLDELTQSIGKALKGRLLTREELGKQVGSATLAQSSWGTLLRPAAFAGLLCFGPNEGQRVRFTRPDTWVRKKFKRMDPSEATAEVTRRFLGSYGPATVQDLARWWSGGGVITSRKWIEALGDEVVPVDIEGTQAWMLASDEISGTVRSVRLLPAFDPYVLGASHHTDRLLPSAGLRPRVFRPQGWVSPVLLVNGFIHGIWKHEIKGSRVAVTIEPFVPVPVWVRKATEAEAERLSTFLGSTLRGPSKLTWVG